MDNPDFKPSFNRDLGPIRIVPEIYTHAPTTFRNIGTDCRGLEYGGSATRLNTPMRDVISLGTPWDSEDLDYVTDGGYLLYESDGLGGVTYSGYNILWQHKVTQVGRSSDGLNRIVSYNLSLRVIKVHHQNPLDMEELCSQNIGLGWNNNNAHSLDVGYTACQAVYEDENYIGFGYCSTYDDPNNNPYGGYRCQAISEHWFTTHLYINPMKLIEDPNELDPEGPSKPGGGDGNHNRKTEAVTLPDLPDLGALDAGMITLYRLTGPEMSDFTAELWSFWSAIKAFFADPLDFVVGAMIVPFTPTSTRKARPKFGFDVWNTAFDVILEQFYSISCGTIDIEKYYGSCFDYDPYHKLQIYIPYVGYRDLPVDQVMGKTIELTYHIDCMTGDFVAFVHTPVVGAYGPQLAQIISQFAGTMGVHVPLTRQSFDEVVKAGINLLGGAVGMAAGGIAQSAGLEGGDLNANQIASQASSATVSAINSMKRSVIRSGSIGASSGMLAKQNPFIISTLPRQSLPENYKDLEGYPSNIYGTVGSFSGYLAVETVKLNVTATSTEKEMIMQMLKGGVFV